MATEKQIIGFIEPSKFAGLLGTNLPINYRQNSNFLNNGNNLVYIQTYGTYEVAAYDNEKAIAASIILVADTFNFQYVPEVPFKVLFHTQTDETTRVQRLRDMLNHFHGELKSIEEANTPYKKIADLINKKEGVTFEAIYDEIKDFDPEEETLTEVIFNAIYEQQGEDVIEKAVSKRDKYIKEKGKN